MFNGRIYRADINKRTDTYGDCNGGNGIYDHTSKEGMEENARNTEAGANSEPVDKSEEEQNPAGSRWEYMKTMESYKMALYMAASVNEMPHMMLNSAEYWKKWLEAEVDENGDELSKK